VVVGKRATPARPGIAIDRRRSGVRGRLYWLYSALDAERGTCDLLPANLNLRAAVGAVMTVLSSAAAEFAAAAALRGHRHG